MRAKEAVLGFIVFLCILAIGFGIVYTVGDTKFVAYLLIPCLIPVWIALKPILRRLFGEE